MLNDKNNNFVDIGQLNSWNEIFASIKASHQVMHLKTRSKNMIKALFKGSIRL